MNLRTEIFDWLMEGDPAIRWQVLRDLTDASPESVASERQRVATEGWGAALLALQSPEGKWGGGLYSPKWISTHYTLMLLRRLGLPQDHPQAQKGCLLLLDKGFYSDGGINLFPSYNHSETCVTGMILSLLAYFQIGDPRLEPIVDHLLRQQMADGGWNCESYHGHHHSSFHTTISVLEGLWEYEKCFPGKRPELPEARNRAHEFLLIHRLFRSHRTGKIVDRRMTRFAFPPRWRYDVMRVLDYFQDCLAPFDPRMQEALDLLHKKEKNGQWPLQNRHPGRTFFEMEKPGEPSRWNTLRGCRIERWVVGRSWLGQ